jgi:hypothetical protein
MKFERFKKKKLKITCYEYFLKIQNFLFKFIYNLHKWDSIQCEFKNIFIKSLTKFF